MSRELANLPPLSTAYWIGLGICPEETGSEAQKPDDPIALVEDMGQDEHVNRGTQQALEGLAALALMN